MPACVAKQPNVMFDPHLQIIQGISVNIIRWPQKDAIFRPFTVPYAIFYLFFSVADTDPFHFRLPDPNPTL